MTSDHNWHVLYRAYLLRILDGKVHACTESEAMDAGILRAAEDERIARMWAA